MKQKIVIKALLNCDKCRSKALKIAAVANGVSSVSVEGEDRDQVVVTGDRIDSFRLAKALRKKFGYANILTVEEVKDKKDKKEEETKPQLPIISYYPPTVSVAYDHEYHYGSFCIIM